MKRAQLATEDLLKSIKEEHDLQPGYITPLSQVGGSSPVVGETYSRSLDDAATLLLNLLTPSIRDYAMELADVTLKLPRWQLLLGSMLAQYESGCLVSPSIDPSWRQAEAVMSDSICELAECRAHFIPKRFGQRFCSQTCGDISRKQGIDEMHERRRQEMLSVRREEREFGIRAPEFKEDEA